MLITSRQMLRNARDGGYAVAAFNVENAEMLQAVMEAAEELSAPVILQTTPGTLRYLPPSYFAAMAKAAAPQIPAALHLDHGSSYELVQRCLQAGYTSVMIDGSALAYEENIALTKSVCEYAADMGASVEAELGRVGGKEDDLEDDDSQYTDPTQAADFARRTGVDSLAIAVGTAHGVYKTAPRLELDRVTQARGLMDTPIVLHGASGLSDDSVREAVSCGVSKINFATELRIAFTDAARRYLDENPDTIDPKKYLAVGRDAVKEVVRKKIELCGGCGRAK